MPVHIFAFIFETP